MTQRQTQLTSGGSVQIRESVLRGSGPEGPQGPRGVDGRSLNYRGSKATLAEITAMTNSSALQTNDAWFCDETGHLYVWRRDDDRLPSGKWTDGGRLRGQPGYLNSVAARAIEATTASAVEILPDVPVVLRWKLASVDTEIIPTDVGGDITTGATPRPIVVGYRSYENNAVATDEVDRIKPSVPPGLAEPNADYPLGAAAYLVNIAVDLRPTSLVVPRGVAALRLYWWNTSNVRVLIAEAQTYITDKESTLLLSTYVRGRDGGVYEVEVASNVSGWLETRRWEWVRAGGGPGPQGRPGTPGPALRAHPQTPLASTLDLQTTPGSDGQFILTADTGQLWVWQALAINSTEKGWVAVGVIRGAPGDANSGMSSFDAVSGDNQGGSGSAEAGWAPDTVADQGAPYPKTGALPRVPYYLKALGQWAATRIVARFADDTARTAARPAPTQGEVSYLGSGTSAARGLQVFTGDPGYLRIPSVVVSTAAAPTGATAYPDGTLWIKV